MAQYKKYVSIQKIPGRPYLLVQAELDAIAAEIVSMAPDAYPTLDDILHFISDNFNKVPSKSTVRRVILERIPGFKIVEVSPLELERFDCKYEDIQAFYADLTTELEGVATRFCFNLDESGQIDYVDATKVHVIVPVDADVSRYGVSRSTRRITLLHCIATDGTFLPDFAIVKPDMGKEF